MRPSRLLLLSALILVLTPALNIARADEPDVSQRFPVVDRSNLSPPVVSSPIHECARTVWVSGFLPKATVSVFADGALVGQANPQVGFGPIPTSPLLLGQKITATQTVGTVTSGKSHEEVPVTIYPTLPRPVVGSAIYECGQVVPVSNLVASTHVEVSDANAPPLPLLGSGETSGDWLPVVTSPLVKGHHPVAKQIACPDMLTKRVESTPSDGKVPVLAEPSPLLPPEIESPVIRSNDTVVLHKLYVGAVIEVKVGGNRIGGGIATGADNWVSVTPIPANSGSVTATQTLCSTSPPSVPVPVTDQLDAPLLGGPICPGSHYVMVDKTTLNASVVLRRSGQTIGYGGAAMGTLKLPVGDNITLNEGDVLTVVQYISDKVNGDIISPESNTVTVGCGSGGNVATQHNDNNRTGVYPFEGTLTPSQVQFHGMVVKYTVAVDGPIRAQPLYVRRVGFRSGVADGLFVADVQIGNHDANVYAIDANTGAIEWKTPMKDSDTNARPCATGIETTPVIDVPNHRIYVVFGTNNKCGTISVESDQEAAFAATLDAAFWLVSLDYATGQELSRTRIAASLFRANGTPVVFDARFQRNHAALLLDHGSVYVAFCSIAPAEWTEFHGWVMAYRAWDLGFQGVWCASKNYRVPPSRYQTTHNPQIDGAGIWQGGGGLAADPDGNLYFLTGNGKADVANDKYGDCIIKLTPTGGSLIPQAFIPPNVDAMLKNDADLGSGGALTIPGTHFVIGGGKPGYMYLLDRTTMQPVQPQFIVATNQTLPLERDQSWDNGPHLHGAPTYWRGPHPKFGNLYVWGEKDFLRLYHFDTTTGKVITTVASVGPVLALQNTPPAPAIMPGGMVSLSSEGNGAHTGVVWATLPDKPDFAPNTPARPGHLYAFDAENLKPLWDTAFPSLGHWVPPTIADGKVFIATSSDMLIAYELGTGINPHQFPHPALQGSLPSRPTKKSVTRKPALRMDAEDPGEGMMFLPEIAYRALLPQSQFEPSAVLQGDGVQTFAAAQLPSGHGGQPAWQWKGSIVSGSLTRHRQLAAYPGKIEVRVSPGLAWTASDGSSASSVVVKTHAAPNTSDAVWTLYKLTSTGDAGILANVSYILCAFTHGGVPPMKVKAGTTVKTPYHTQYILYRDGRGPGTPGQN